MTVNLSIVVVDDEREVLDSLSAMLSHAALAAGCRVAVRVALTGFDALALCRATAVDAIFVDYNLTGGMNGDEFLSLLGDQASGALIVMMSGISEEELVPIVTQRHRSLGLRFRFLKKPISNLTLESCFFNLVDFARTRTSTTILVASPTPLEWQAWRGRLQDEYEPSPGFLAHGRIGGATVVVALTGKGQTTTAAAIAPLLAAWQPRYVFLVGIAGGVGDARRGDVVVSSFVYSFDFGKVEQGVFRSRPEPNWSADKRLLDVANMLAQENGHSWTSRIRSSRPSDRRRVVSTAHVGYFGSSEKLIDDFEYPVIADALNAAPEILAVEMEAIGANTAIREMHANGQLRSLAGIIMIRGISDEPVTSSLRAGAGRASRSKWASYSADTAAAFAESVILSVFPAREQNANSMTGQGVGAPP